MKYRKKPPIFDAVQYDGFNRVEIFQMGVPEIGQDLSSTYLRIQTPKGEMIAIPGDYIVKGDNDEFYCVKPYIFELTYEAVE